MRTARMRDVDLALRAGEADGEPFLRLAAIAAVPGLADQVARNVVAEPFGNFAETFDRADICFFVQLAQRRRPRLFAVIDAALRHLPSVGEIHMLGPVDAAADEGKAGAVEHDEADAGAIRQGFERHIDQESVTAGQSSDNGRRVYLITDCSSPFRVSSPPP